jgi:hypothetical protein
MTVWVVVGRVSEGGSEMRVEIVCIKVVDCEVSE